MEWLRLSAFRSPFIPKFAPKPAQAKPRSYRCPFERADAGTSGASPWGWQGVQSWISMSVSSSMTEGSSAHTVYSLVGRHLNWTVTDTQRRNASVAWESKPERRLSRTRYLHVFTRSHFTQQVISYPLNISLSSSTLFVCFMGGVFLILFPSLVLIVFLKHIKCCHRVPSYLLFSL